MSSAAAASNTASDDISIHNLGVLLNLLFFSALMVIVPASTFTASQYGYFDSFYETTFGLPSDKQRVTYSGLVAIASVNLVIASYIIKAFCEPAPPPLADKKQQ